MDHIEHNHERNSRAMEATTNTAVTRKRQRRLSEDEEEVEPGFFPFPPEGNFLKNLKKLNESLATYILTMTLPPKRSMPPCPNYEPYSFKSKWTLKPFANNECSSKGKGSSTDSADDSWAICQDEETTVTAAMAKMISVPPDAAIFLKELTSMPRRVLLIRLSNTLFDRSFFDNVIESEILVETFRLAIFNNNHRHMFIVMMLGLFINRATVRDCINTMLNRCCDYKDNLDVMYKRHSRITLLYLLQVRQIPHLPVFNNKYAQDLENTFRRVFENRRCLWILAMESILRRGAGLNEMLRTCRRTNLPESVKRVIHSYFYDIILKFISTNKARMYATDPEPRYGRIWLAPMYKKQE